MMRAATHVWKKSLTLKFLQATRLVQKILTQKFIMQFLNTKISQITVSCSNNHETIYYKNTLCYKSKIFALEKFHILRVE